MKYCLHIVLLLDAGNVYFQKYGLNLYMNSLPFFNLYAFIVLDIIAKSKKLIVSHFQRITPFVEEKHKQLLPTKQRSIRRHEKARWLSNIKRALDLTSKHSFKSLFP